MMVQVMRVNTQNMALTLKMIEDIFPHQAIVSSCYASNSFNAEDVRKVQELQGSIL